MDFNELAGDLTVEMDHLKNFVKAWYEPQDVVSIVGIRPSRNRAGVLSMAVPVKDLTTWTEEDIWGLAKRKDGTIFGTYISLYPVKDASKVSVSKRGTEDNIGNVHGVFVDIDIKPGSFETKEDAVKFLTEGDIPKPTILVDNGGTGGLHAYWKFNWSTYGNKSHLEMWHAFISSKSPVKIDRLIDLTRLSRMPSSIYWPKDGTEGGKPGTVSVSWSDGPQYSVEMIESLSKEAWSSRKERISRVIDSDSKMKLDTSLLAAELGVGGLANSWQLFAAIAVIEENFNEMYSWADILQPLGWTFLKKDGQEREEWARPGRFEKSATVNWPSSPDMMSLLSESPETGLADLKEAGIALTKYRVARRLLWNDDVNRMTMDVVNQLNGK